MNQQADKTADFAIQNEPLQRPLSMPDDYTSINEIVDDGIDNGLEFDEIGEALASKFDAATLGTELAEALDSIWGLRAQIRILEQKLKNPSGSRT